MVHIHPRLSRGLIVSDCRHLLRNRTHSKTRFMNRGEKWLRRPFLLDWHRGRSPCRSWPCVAESQESVRLSSSPDMVHTVLLAGLFIIDSVMDRNTSHTPSPFFADVSRHVSPVPIM